ncbi:MAG: biopolymer transporter ExbD [Proteobacteria bacterium]|nr:biopolymer transporter ExbD [Pseudomonadota bacterium]NQW45540.1 biopolymer transporter ExbD [Deltaproteobacteria bacterium]
MGGGGGGGGSSAGSHHGGKYTKKSRSRTHMSTGLMLASMLDILMAILFFLMKNYSQIQSDFNIGKDISLPYSSSVNPPVNALQMVVTQKAVLVDQEKVLDLVNGDIAKQDLVQGLLIKPLALKLKKLKDRSVVQNDVDKKSFAGIIIMQADKSLQFSMLKKILYTAQLSDFVTLKLAVLKKDES